MRRRVSTNGNTQTERTAITDRTSHRSNGDTMSCARCTELEERIAALEAENQRLHDALGRTRDEATVARTKETQVHVDAPDTALSRVEMQRYSRQMLVPDFRIGRQILLRRARVLVIGAGGLGCPVALYLGGMGVGCLGLVDNDSVERSNLHRQIGHDESTIGVFKVESLAKRVRLINPDVVVETHVARFSSSNAAALVDQYDVVVDASDNPATRYLVNDVCATVNWVAIALRRIRQPVPSNQDREPMPSRLSELWREEDRDFTSIYMQWKCWRRDSSSRRCEPYRP